MSRRTVSTVNFPAPAEKIYQDFASRDYWETLMSAYGWLTPVSEIHTFTVTDNGIDVVLRQNLPRIYLPPIAQKVMLTDMVITRVQHFAPFDHGKGSAMGSYSASVPAGPGSFTGVCTLTDTDQGSQLKLSSTCKVYIPFIGGKLEDLILYHLSDLFLVEEGFIADWISKHH
ncbi:DUF2505 domain-containing protein [Mycobacteroides franklinii]|uniref:DUF2505 domain-containing protein n=1 Tax=Mycobacteroides franklinii TaxID=948102 RepID=A0A4R5PBH5_9MYCO|nr:DUF2505 domain-containing protein [Mycobacteroides franklinii]ORA57208.1 hypothetical protein BST24_24500 [Mycobacteroides franklinii]TDH22099.1 DUF2505 domain-containing protein [Mycobacteroides franklinii]